MRLSMTLRSLFEISKKAFTAILVASIMAILIGSVLLIVTYAILSPIIDIGTGMMNSTSVQANSSLSVGYQGTLVIIVQALTVTSISLIVAGVAGIIYMLMGVAGMTGGIRGR